MGNLQSNASSSTQTTEKKYEVFLNFRGIDTRDGFTNYLYNALCAKSVEILRNEEGIEKGEEIGPKLLKAIRDSMISVVIFSKEYASSKWCLRELVEIMKCAKKNSQTVIPVFYKVNVHDVRHQEGSFKDGFDQLKKEFEENLEKEHVDSADVETRKKEFYQEMQKWRQALEDASRLKGWRVEGPESRVIVEIVKDIWEKLMKAYKLSLCDFKGKLFGIEERLKQVKSLLCLDKTDIRITRIWGMGGIGIDDAIYHQISKDEYSKCFIQNVRQRLEQCGGLVSVPQQEVLSKVLNDQDIKLDGVTLPQHIKEGLCWKKGTNAIKGIFLNMSQLNEEHLSSQAFEKMTNLIFLKFYDSSFSYSRDETYSSNVCFPNSISYLSNKLRYLNWLGYPLKALPSNFNPNCLVELDLSYSNIEEHWEKNTHAPNLRDYPYLIKACPSHTHFPSLTYLHLERCNKLTSISDLLDAPLLEKIDIQFYENLFRFAPPVHHFNNLRELKVSNCKNLQSFPNNISFPSPVYLNLSKCINLVRISDVLDAPLLETIRIFNCKSLLDFPPPA